MPKGGWQKKNNKKKRCTLQVPHNLALSFTVPEKKTCGLYTLQVSCSSKEKPATKLKQASTYNIYYATWALKHTVALTI